MEILTFLFLLRQLFTTPPYSRKWPKSNSLCLKEGENEECDVSFAVVLRSSISIGFPLTPDVVTSLTTLTKFPTVSVCSSILCFCCLLTHKRRRMKNHYAFVEESVSLVVLGMRIQMDVRWTEHMIRCSEGLRLLKAMQEIVDHS